MNQMALNLYSARVGTELSDLADQDADLPIIDNPVVWDYVEKHQVGAFRAGIKPRCVALLAIVTAFPGYLDKVV